MGDKDGDLLVGLGRGHRLEHWLCDLLRILGQLLRLDLGGQSCCRASWSTDLLAGLLRGPTAVVAVDLGTAARA